MSNEIPTSNVPEHECHDDCKLPAVVSFIGIESAEGSLDTSIEVHRVSVAEIAQSLVRMFDSLIDSGNPELPLVIRFAKAREELRKAIETVDPPGDVLLALNGIADGDDE